MVRMGSAGEVTRYDCIGGVGWYVVFKPAGGPEQALQCAIWVEVVCSVVFVEEEEEGGGRGRGDTIN